MNYRGLIQELKQFGEGGEGDSRVIEVIAQANELFDQADWVQCNKGMTNLTSQRTGYPQAQQVAAYEGVLPTRGTKRQVTDATSRYFAISEVDAGEVDNSADPAQTRFDEAKAHLIGMGEQLSYDVFYDNEATNPKGFTGFTPRFNSLGGAGGGQIVDGGGVSTDNTSIWLVVWGPITCSLIYPRGAQMGIKRVDHDPSDPRLYTAPEGVAGGKYKAYAESFEMHGGLAIRDMRSVVRIANIDVSDVEAGNVNLARLLTAAYYKIRTVPSIIMPEKMMQERGMERVGAPAFYAGKTIAEALDNEVQEKTNIAYKMKEWDGMEINTFKNIPIYQMDALLTNEARVV